MFEILDVGDGACAVVRCLWAGCSSIAVVDCGERNAPSSRPAGRLEAHLGSELSEVDTLVVTHFDADHWKGLRDLALPWSRLHPALAPEVTLVYPGLPAGASTLSAGVLALMSTASGSSGVRANDLIRAWQSVSSVRQLALCEGESFRMGCDQWEVLWPPRHLPYPMFAAISDALAELQDFAQRLADSGHRELLENLEIAYGEGLGFGAADDQQDATPTEFSDEGLQRAMIQSLREEQTDQDVVHGLGSVEGEVVSVAFPPPFDGEARRISQRLAKLTNLLSLVFDNRRNHYQPKTLVCGDLAGSPLRYLAKEAKFCSRYDLVVAPHHGSHGLPHDFPSARVCVSQAGPGHYRNWSKHLNSHYDSHCRSTFRSGGVISVL